MRAILCAALCAFGFASSALAQELTPPPSAQLAPGEAASSLLPPLIAHSRHEARLENGRLVGEGGDFLRALGANADFMLLGETHGTADIAAFATALWRDLHADGYRYAAVEIDPYVAEALTRETRAGGVAQWGQFLATHGGDVGAPFFNWDAEAAFAAEIARTSDAETPIWGLDQVFIASAGWILRDVAAGTRSAEARALATRLSDQAQADDMRGLSALDRAELETLRDLLSAQRDARRRETAEAMIASYDIYRPFTGGDGEALLANTQRETLMKRAFQQHYEAALREDRSPPRVLFKFGANHAFRGASLTQVQALGGFVSEFAIAHGARAATILVVCGPGGQAARFRAEPAPCDEEFDELELGALRDSLSDDAISVFDLRVWRLRPGRWAHLPATMQRVIGSYDALVVLPGGRASEVLPGLERAM